jgi:hypothetical protein
MSVNDVTNDVDIVKQMQPNGDLENILVMFDHFKCIEGWTTMACHVYDPSCIVNFKPFFLQHVMKIHQNSMCFVEKDDLFKNDSKGFMVDGV